MKINLEFNLEQINGLLGALAQLPFIQSANLISLIQEQATPQIMAQQEASKDESETTS